MFAFLHDGNWECRGSNGQWLHLIFNENDWFSSAIDNIIALENTIHQNETSFLRLSTPSIKKFKGQHVLIKLLHLDLAKIIFPQHYWFKVACSVYSDINTQKNFVTFLMTVLSLSFFTIKLFIPQNIRCKKVKYVSDVPEPACDIYFFPQVS